MNKSESITNLAAALVKFNSEVKIIEKDAQNPHFKNQYATLDNIIDGVRPILAKFGLSVMQFPAGDGEQFSLTSILLHESGEWIESPPLIMRPVKNDPQGIGSCATYARRYSISALLSLNTGEDDDGNEASQPQHKPPISAKQVGLIKVKVKELAALGGKEEAIYTSLKVKIGEFNELSDLNIEQASTAIDILTGWVEKKKAQKETVNAGA